MNFPRIIINKVIYKHFPRIVLDKVILEDRDFIGDFLSLSYPSHSDYPCIVGQWDMACWNKASKVIYILFLSLLM